MALVSFFFIILAFVAVIFQLVTPLLLNLPAMALVVLTLLIAWYYFKRRRKKVKVPLFSGLNLAIQFIIFLLSLAVFFVVTLPNENPEDSPAVINAVRRVLVRNGWVSQESVKVPAPNTNTNANTNAAPIEINAPKADKIEFKIEDASKEKGDTNPPVTKEESHE